MNTEYINFVNVINKKDLIYFDQIYDIDVIENHLIKFEHFLDHLILSMSCDGNNCNANLNSKSFK